MAKVITEFTRPTKNGNAKYPWQQWTDGRIWRVVRGEDFQSTPQSFRSGLANRAVYQGLTCLTRIEGDAVEFQFLPKDTA